MCKSCQAWTFSILLGGGARVRGRHAGSFGFSGPPSWATPGEHASLDVLHQRRTHFAHVLSNSMGPRRKSGLLGGYGRLTLGPVASWFGGRRWLPRLFALKS